MSYLVIDNVNKIQQRFDTLRDISNYYKMSYAKTCRIYRKDFPENKRVRTVKMLEAFQIVDIDYVPEISKLANDERKNENKENI